MSVYQILRRAAAMWPDRPFATTPLTTLTYSQFHELVLATAAGYRDLAERPIVTILGDNSPSLMLAVFSASAAGGAYLNLNTRNSIEANLAICNLGRPNIIASDRAHMEHANEIMGSVESLTSLLSLEEDEGGIRVAGLPSAARPVDPARPEPTSLSSMASTGGTTGLPKLAPITVQAIDTTIANAWSALDFRSYDPVHLVVAPLSHAASTMTIMLTAAGAHHVVQRRFDVQAVIGAIESQRVTDMYLPPTAIYNLLADPTIADRDMSSLRHIFYAGAPMSSQKLREGLELIGPVFTQFYGQAEAPLTATCLTPEEHVEAAEKHPHRLTSCGRPTLFTEVAILDDGGNTVATGERGEVGILGPLAMDGYVGDTKRAPTQWLLTGDIGYVDDDGYLYLIDRKRDVIVSGGFNVFPIEVEQALWARTEVEDCAVIGLPDEKWGEAVTAFVVLKPGMYADESDLIRYCKATVGSVKAPKAIQFVETLPKSPVGKVLKRALRDQFWPDAERVI
jgi:acyl-CoA synthetase (AMP-forming)/AMP-acid ligase II